MLFGIISDIIAGLFATFPNMNLDVNENIVDWWKIIEGTSDKIAFEMKKVVND